MVDEPRGVMIRRAAAAAAVAAANAAVAAGGLGVGHGADAVGLAVLLSSMMTSI